MFQKVRKIISINVRADAKRQKQQNNKGTCGCNKFV